MAIAAEEIGAVLVGDEQEKIRTGRFRHCDALVHSSIIATNRRMHSRARGECHVDAPGFPQTRRKRHRVLQLRHAGRGAAREPAARACRSRSTASASRPSTCMRTACSSEALELMGDEADNVLPRSQGRARAFHRRRASASRRWTRWRSTWRCCRSTRSGIARSATPPPAIVQDPEREARRAVRVEAGPLRRLRVAAAAVSRSRGAAARDRDEEAGPAAARRSAAASLGEDFADPKFHPVWAKAEELGAVLFIHPQSTPELAKRFKGNGWLSNTIGNPLDTTIALQHLIFEGTLDKFPGLKILAAHGGGYLPSYAPRSRPRLLRVAARTATRTSS